MLICGLAAIFSNQVSQSDTAKVEQPREQSAERSGGDIYAEENQDKLVAQVKFAEPPLTKLLEECDEIAASHQICDSNIYKPVWRKFETSLGQIIKLDTDSIRATNNGGAMAWIYSYDPSAPFNPTNLRQIYFTCRGRFADIHSPNYLMDAPPRSAIGIVASAVCAVAEPERRAILQSQRESAALQKQRAFDPEADKRAKNPLPEDYCAGFSEDACQRIKKGVEQIDNPAYCQPGFARVDSGLSDEDVRVCYARAPKNGDF